MMYTSPLSPKFLKWKNHHRFYHRFVSLFRLTPCERSSESSIDHNSHAPDLEKFPFLVFHRAMGLSRFIGADVKPNRQKHLLTFQCGRIAFEKSIIHFKFSKWFVQTKSGKYMFLNQLCVCVFFLPPKFTCLVCEVRTSLKREVTRAGRHWISLILRLDRSEFCVDFEERYAIASKSKETNVTEGLDLWRWEKLQIIALKKGWRKIESKEQPW